MKNKFTLSLITSLGLCLTSFAATQTPSIGIVNYSDCVQNSKQGKKESDNMEAVRKQMEALVEDCQKQIDDLTAKVNNPEYLDGLSPEAEEELKIKMQTLQQEQMRYRTQYYQVMEQARHRMHQSMVSSINAAAEVVAQEKKFDMIIPKDLVPFSKPELDITAAILTEMDKKFEEMEKAANDAKAIAQDAKVEEKPSDMK